jgi:hypothetical protein
VVAHKFRVKAFDAQGNEIWSVTPPVTPGAQLPQSVDTAAAVGQFDGRRGLELAFLSNSTHTPNPPRSLSIYTLDPNSASPVWAMDRRNARGQAIDLAPSFVNGFVAGAYQTLLHRDPTDSERNAGVDALLNNRTNLPEFARMVVNQSGGAAIWGGQLNDATAGSIQDRFGPVYQATTGNGAIPADSLAAMLFDAHRGTSGTELAARSYASGGNYASTNFLAGWVRSVFRDVLNREAQPGETAAMLNVLDAGTTTPGQLVDFLLGTPEARVNYVRDQVQHYLGREATPQDIAGLVYYVRREDVIVALVSSPEYYQRAGGTTEGLVRAAYRDILNIPNAPANEVQYWVGQLTARTVPPRRGRRPRPTPIPTPAATPATLADSLTRNPIYRDAWVVDTLMKFTPDISRGVLRVPIGVPGGPINPDPGIVNNFTAALSLGYTQTDILAALMTSFNYYFSASYNRGIFTGWGVRR